MNLAFRVALSFVRRKNSRMPSFTALVSLLGVSFGVAAFLVVVTVFNSFEHQLRQILLAANPHLVVYKFPRGIPDARAQAQDFVKKIRAPVDAYSLFDYNEVILSRGDRTAAVVMRALEGTASASAADLAPFIEPAQRDTLAALDNARSVLPASSRDENAKTHGGGGKDDQGQKGQAEGSARDGGRSTHAGVAGIPNVILGKELALRLSAKPGDTVTLVSSSFGNQGQNRYQEFKVVGTLRVGLGQYDRTLALINFKDGQALFGEPGWAKGVELRFKDPADALAASKALAPQIPYTVRAWQEIDRGLFEQIERDGAAIKMIVLIITLVAGFNIVVTLSLSVVDRAKQIALLRSVGASRFFIVQVFVAMGTLVGFAGAFLGLLIGIAILRLFAGFELGELQAFYFLERIPVEYDVRLMLSAFAVALALSFFSALYPALKATRVSPLHGLKPQF